MKIKCYNCGGEYNSANGQYCPECGTLNSPQMQQQTTNKFCVAGLIISFFSGLIGLIFSIIGFNMIKKTKEQGKGMAIAGIIISSIRIVISSILIFIILIVALAYSEDYESSPSFSRLCDQATYCEYNPTTDNYECLYEDDYGDYQYVTCDTVDPDVIYNDIDDYLDDYLNDYFDF